MNANELRKKQSEARQTLALAFSGPVGAEALEMIKGMAAYGAPAYAPGRDALEAAWLDGRKSLVHDILTMINTTK